MRNGYAQRFAFQVPCFNVLSRCSSMLCGSAANDGKAVRTGEHLTWLVSSDRPVVRLGHAVGSFGARDSSRRPRVPAARCRSPALRPSAVCGVTAV